MTHEKLKTVLSVGETVSVEFKRCANGISADTYETVCSFLNRFGGDIFLGVEDNGDVCGVPENAAPDIIKNFIKSVSNPEIISPTVYLASDILEYEGKHIIHIHIPPSSEVHSCKKIIYDRVDDSDVKVTATGQIAALYIRKQNIFTEKKVYPYVRDDDLRLDLLPRLRQIAANRVQNHEWKTINDMDLMKSAGLYGEDKETGNKGYNLAAVMLLGRDEVIHSINPVYRTDALLRKVNLDRYDDRVIVKTNLIESYELLALFFFFFLLDKFYLENDTRVSLRGLIIREMLVNTLIHREYTSSFVSKFIIEKDRMYTENANRAVTGGEITPENLEPNPKNPIIAAFFRNIWLADELGSGVRRLYRYVPRYSGKKPVILDGDVFRIIVPLDDSYSFDAQLGRSQIKGSDCTLNCTLNCTINCTINCTLTEKAILEHLHEYPTATQAMVASAIGKSLRTVKMDMIALREKGLLEHEGAKKNGRWIVKQ
jgi:ATP-dependent DNA helicase RecG